MTQETYALLAVGCLLVALALSLVEEIISSHKE